ncbi:MAG: hypothetical protein ACAH83_15815 [Alphaproteobacteria bacterium]
MNDRFFYTLAGRLMALYLISFSWIPSVGLLSIMNFSRDERHIATLLAVGILTALIVALWHLPQLLWKGDLIAEKKDAEMDSNFDENIFFVSLGIFIFARALPGLAAGHQIANHLLQITLAFIIVFRGKGLLNLVRQLRSMAGK